MSDLFPPPWLPRRPGGAGNEQQYRCYFLTGESARISRSHEFEAADDAAAIRLAEAWREGRVIELWCGDRKIKCWD